ncbi:MAG: glycosyltransferase family 2 protein [Rhodobacteraceae bacterium]|nr:glycosyltransferase family 2 protein [Paracoccaceae bacterium]
MGGCPLVLIVSLSSIPPRFSRIGPTLDSLLGQSVRPERIVLNIPASYRRFPDWDGTLPQVPQGVEIRRTGTDLGPATKVLPTARAYQGQTAEILFCDDDRIYGSDWAAGFLAARRDYPDAAIALRGLSAAGLAGTCPSRTLQPRALPRREIGDLDFQLRRLWRRLSGNPKRPERRLFRRSGYTDMFEGCSGVLVRPDWFGDDAFDIPNIAWLVDDVWLSGMLAKRGIPIWLAAGKLTPENTNAQAAAPLAGADRHKTNQDAVRFMQDTYGIWLG